MGTQIVGAASVSYVPIGASTAISVTLGTPLHDVSVRTAKERRAVDTLDFTGREVVTYGGGRAEVAGTIRFHNNAQELLDLVESGLDKQAVTYKHGSTHTGIVAWLIDASEVEPDRDRAGFGEYQVQITLRRNTTGDWSSIL